jgi:hypothetical protein
LRFAPPRHALHGTPITRAVQDPLNCYSRRLFWVQRPLPGRHCRWTP